MMATFSYDFVVTFVVKKNSVLNLKISKFLKEKMWKTLSKG